MPQPKRRKLSLEEHDGKDYEKNRAALRSSNGAVEKHATSNDAVSGKEGSGSQSEKRPPKNEKKAETSLSSSISSSSATAADDNKDGTASSSFGDVISKVSSSGRVIKQTKKGRCFSAAREAAQNKQSTAASQTPSSAAVHAHPKPPVPKPNTPVRGKRGRKRRSWDCWSKFEQDAFFEGLFEHGKDFDAIHNLLAFRSKKRGIDPSLIKTKEQVRYLYYRMWQKISKHVHMGNNVKKETQEIYGLVNYYSIIKIFKRIDERAVEHLNELIHTGVTKVRDPNMTGKKNNRRKVRILRTPVCNALKKLNNIEDAKEEFVTELPQQVTIELTPRSSAAWLKVHNLSQNPRVRFHVSVNRSLSALMEHLQKKWRGPTDRARQSLGGHAGDTDEMVLFPHHSYTLEPVTLAPQRATSVDLITFSSYMNNVVDSPYATNKSAKKTGPEEVKGSENSSDPEGHGPVDSPRIVKSSVKTSLLQKLSESAVQLPHPPCEDENAMFPDAPLSSSPAKDSLDLKSECGSNVDALATNDEVTVTLPNCDIKEPSHPDSSPETSPHSKEKQRDCRDEERETDMRKLVESAVKGFTRESCSLVTLAQLSLMLGKTAHIRLEYEWRPRWTPGGIGAMGSGIIGEVERLTNMLRRLSNLANLEYRDIMQRAKVTAGSKMSQCTLCGHSLDKSTQRKKACVDACTETDPLTAEALGGVSTVHPAKLNSNGTLVGMAAKSTTFISSTKELMPDTDGVFRVPMPIPVPVPIRSCYQRMSTQPTFSQLTRPPEARSPVPNYLVPRKRKPHRRPVISQRTLLPKITTNPLILVSQDIPQNLEPGLQSSQPLAQGAVPTLQSLSQEVDVVMGTAISSVASSASSVQEVDAGIPIVSTPNFLTENSSDMFSGNLDMPVVVPLTSSPEKSTSTQQLIQNSVSPPSLSSMLDISLPAPSNQSSDAGDKFLDMIVNSNTGFSDLLKTPEKERSSGDILHTPQHSLSTPPSSPRRSPLKAGAESQWFSELSVFQTPELHFLSSPAKKPQLIEGVDLQGPELSLSRFLESPVKKSEAGESGGITLPGLSNPSTSSSSASFIPAPPSLFGESSQDSLAARLDVETALQSVMMESSIDYSSKFERLAEHLAENTDASQPNI